MLCITHHSQMFGITGSNELGCSNCMNETNWSNTVGVLSFFVIRDRPCRKSKSSSRKRRSLSFWMGTVFWSMLQQYDLFLSDFRGMQCLFTCLLRYLPLNCGYNQTLKEKAARTEGAGCAKAPYILHLLCYDLWRFGAGCLSLSGPRLSRPRLLKRNDESRRPKGSSLLPNEL